MVSKKLIEKIIQWGKDRDLLRVDNYEKQSLKLFEEYGELCKAIIENKPKEIADAIGDIFVVKTLLGEMQERRKIKIDIFKYNKILMLVMFLADFIEEADVGGLDIHLSELSGELVGKPLDEVVADVYNEIKDRKGKTVNGTFIREK